jgi:hypothetical protein
MLSSKSDEVTAKTGSAGKHDSPADIVHVGMDLNGIITIIVSLTFEDHTHLGGFRRIRRHLNDEEVKLYIDSGRCIRIIKYVGYYFKHGYGGLPDFVGL